MIPPRTRLDAAPSNPEVSLRPGPSAAVARLAELRAKVDAFCARVADRYPGALACGPGCSDCCRRELTVTAVEGVGIAEVVAAAPPAVRAELARRAREGAPCVALDPDGRCSVYEERPIVCRSHGVPIRFTSHAEGGKRALPVIDACPKNFTGMELASLDPGVLLDQETLSVILGSIDALFAGETGAPRGVRRSLRDVVLAAASERGGPGGQNGSE